MADKRDLVEAYSFSRRRLVTAFVSGAPGGREVEPPRTGRTIVGGLALAVLLLAGAAVAGVFQDPHSIDWSQPALITDEDTGALYVNLGEGTGDDRQLRAVVNVTSAQLILGNRAKPQEVSSETIAETRRGPTIGIVDAPAAVPSTDALLNTGWTACTARDRGTQVDVAARPAVDEVPAGGLVVQSGGDRWLIATARATADAPESAHRYRFPPNSDGLYPDLGVAIPTKAIPVSTSWLELFPEGGALDAESLDIVGAGELAPDVAGYPSGARVGDYFTEDEQEYVITRSGQVAADPFALAVLRNTEYAGQAPRELQVGEIDWHLVSAPYEAARWPKVLPEEQQQHEGTQVCAVLHTDPGQPPAVGVAIEPEDHAAATHAGAPVVAIVAGHGAVVRSADWGTATGGAPYLVDDRGTSHRLADQQAIDSLGYAGLDWVVVPDVWLKLFEAGVELSRDAALCPPVKDPEAVPCG